MILAATLAALAATVAALAPIRTASDPMRDYRTAGRFIDRRARPRTFV